MPLVVDGFTGTVWGTWRRLCRAESERTIVMADHHVANYEKAIIEPPAKVGRQDAVGTAVLSPIAPPGPAIYRAKVTFPIQVSSRCVILWPSSFVTPDIPFTVAAAH